jgi:hypothetical protein
MTTTSTNHNSSYIKALGRVKNAVKSSAFVGEKWRTTFLATYNLDDTTKALGWVKNAVKEVTQ